MFTPQETTNERVDVWVGALEREKAGVEARIAGLKNGARDPGAATAEVLDARLKNVDAEIKRVNGLKKKEPAAA